MGEEWRKGWHPEVIAPKASDDQVLIVGAGPAGLECARALGRRGYEVMLAEATTELGGRVAARVPLPGLSEWGRVRDYRLQQILPMPNVELYRDSRPDRRRERAASSASRGWCWRPAPPGARTASAASIQG